MNPTCAGCGYRLQPQGRWCDACGARRPGVEAPTWTAEVVADRSWFDQVAMSDVAYPRCYPARRFSLREGESTIGRRSERRGIEPDLDLGGALEDPGISRLHAVVVVDERGRCSLTDLGSTNGTYLDGASDPLEQGVATPLADRSMVRLGAWTLITFCRDG